MTREEGFFTTFIKVSKAISSTLDLQEILDLILKNGIDSLDLQAGVISLLNKKDNRLEVIAHRNLSDEFINKGPILADKSMPDAIETKRPAVLENIENECQLQYPEACKKEGIQAILSVPIVFKDALLGILRLYDDKPREFSYREVEFITALAEQGGIAIQNARYMQKVKHEHEKEVDELWDWFNSMSGTTMLDG
jgi:GAF domain-containing protein